LPAPSGDELVPLELDRPTPSPPSLVSAPPPRRLVPLLLTIAAMIAVLGAFAAARTFIARATPKPPPGDVIIRVVDLPHNGNARVFLDGAPVAATFTMHGDREQHRLRLQAAGYADKALLFAPDADQTIDGRMSRSSPR
jgi:hypothetical protein